MFTKYKTFFIVFGVLVFFLMLFAHACRVEGFSDQTYVTKDQIYEKDSDVNINGLFNNTTEKYKRYNTAGPFSSELLSSSSCKQECYRQDECNPIHQNVCKSSYNETSKKCSCSFRKKVVIEPFNELINRTVATMQAKAMQFDNFSKSCWVYQKTNDKYDSVGTEIVPWRDLNIPDNKNMAFSFWITFIGEVKDTHGFLVLLSGIITVFFVNKDKILVMRNSNDFKEYKIPIPKDQTVWITVSFSPGAQDIYVNGKFTFSSNSKQPFVPPNDRSALVLGQGAKGIFIKDLKFYDHSLTEERIGILYRGLTAE